MSNEELAEAQRQLREYGSLEECLLDDIRVRRFGTEVHLVFNYIWDAKGRVRERAQDEPRHVEIRCFGVQEFNLENHLTSAMLDEPDQLNWGLTEVAVVSFDSHRLKDRDGVRVTARWEGNRRLSIIAAGLEFVAPLDP